MRHLFLILFSGILILQSCGEDKKPIKSGESGEPKLTLKDDLNISNDLVVTINADYNTNDEIVLFWKDKNIGWFDGKNTVYGGAADVDGHQNIEFKLPNGIIPNDIRLDISSNKTQGDIKINFIKFKSAEREFYVFGDELDKYFEGNEFLTIENGSKKIKLKANGENYDPFFSTKHELILELEKVLNTAF